MQPPVPAAIAPHLLHSPVSSPAVVNLHNFMDAYHDNSPDSPRSPGYPQSPPPDTSKFTHPEPHPPVPKPVTSSGGMLVVYSYGPPSAYPGAVLTAQVDFTNFSGSNVRLRVVFGDLALPTAVSPNVPLQERELGQERGDWKLRISVPPMGQASDNMAEMGADGRPKWPLTLQALDSRGNLLDSIGFGLFVYENISVSPRVPSPTIYDYKTRSPNKRARQASNDFLPSPTKRLALDPDALNFRRVSVDSFMDSQSAQAAHRTFLDPPTSATTLQSCMSFPPQAFKHHLQPLPQPDAPDQKPSNPQSMSGAATDPADAGAHTDESPALVRTSQLGHDAKPEQASVSIQGDLEAMKREWSHGEYNAGRRLVQFWKRQVGTTLHISFAGITQNDYKENTIVVSCIYRENVDDEYFITSVDVIYLLEALAGNRFEVEEKNRIRRNLEGFKPMTISKSKSGTEEFFRVIMELPAPRPRNIEKDVKVFEWGKLKMMLEKVFSKYSTVPLLQNTTSPQYDGQSHGTSSSLYPYPKTVRGCSVELPHLPSLPIGMRPRTLKRHSPVSGARFRELPSLPPLHISLQNQNVNPPYMEHFLPGRYNDYEEGGLGSGEYSYSGMRLCDFPLELDQTLLKSDMGFGTGHGIVGRHHDSFRPSSPQSCDNSPLSMTLSISSGTSSEGGHVGNKDLAATPVVPVGGTDPQAVQVSHRQL